MTINPKPFTDSATSEKIRAFSITGEDACIITIPWNDKDLMNLNKVSETGIWTPVEFYKRFKQ